MKPKYRIHNAPSPDALQQAARLGANMAIVYSVGPCSTLRFKRDPAAGRYMDEFPIYFDDYPKVAALRRSADAAWLEPLRREIRAISDRALTLGLRPVVHLYEPMLPLAFEREYPELVGVFRRPTQEGTVEVHTHMDPDNPATWELMKAKYRELARDFPQVAMFVITTGDTASSYFCVPQAKMPIHRRLVSMVQAARDGIRQAGGHAEVCLRLWWRNFPDEYYRDGHRLAAEMTGLTNAADLLCRIGKPHNDPSKVLPELFRELPPDVPVMYKSTRMDIHDNPPLTGVLGKYPPDRQQIMEISYEMHHLMDWPWCKVAHIRRGVQAVREHGLAGYVCVPINMGNNDRHLDPESGNLGRMNTWLFEQLLGGDARPDAELVAAWLGREFGSPQPQPATDAIIDADVLADEGINWGSGVHNRMPFASLHTTKLYWTWDGFIQPAFPYSIANPTRELLESMIAMKHAAHERARGHIAAIEAARPEIHPGLFEELHTGYSVLADYVLLARDWGCYLLMQYGIEKGVYPADRLALGRMSRYVESFIRNLAALHDSPAGKRAAARITFPDPWPLT